MSKFRVGDVIVTPKELPNLWVTSMRFLLNREFTIVSIEDYNSDCIPQTKRTGSRIRFKEDDSWFIHEDEVQLDKPYFVKQILNDL